MEKSSLNAQPKQGADRSERALAYERFFANALMRVSGTTSREEARAAEWRFDGQYYAPERGEESTNYQAVTEKVIPPEGEITVNKHEEEDTTARRCTICHVPIDYVNLIGVNGQVVQMGRDCTAKLQRFIETGEIIPTNPAKEIWDEQSDILAEGAEYDKAALEHAGEKRITKRKIVASMLSWLTDHSEDEGVPENVRYAVRSYNNVGMIPSKELAQELADYYKSARKFLPEEILKNKDIEGYESHPHRKWLKKIVGKGVLQEDIPQLKRIIGKGHDLEVQREAAKIEQMQRERQERYEAWLKKEEEARAVREAKAEEQRIAKEKAEVKGKESAERIEKLKSEGLIQAHTFSRINFAADVALARNEEGKKGLGRRFEEDQPLRFYEISSDETVQLYELDQAPPYEERARTTVTGPRGKKMVILGENKPKDFIITGVSEPEKVKLFPQSVVKEVAGAINRKEIPWEHEAVSEKAHEVAPEATVIRHSCAQVVVSRATGEAFVLLANGPWPLEEILKEYRPAEEPNRE